MHWGKRPLAYILELKNKCTSVVRSAKLLYQPATSAWSPRSCTFSTFPLFLTATHKDLILRLCRVNTHQEQVFIET